MNKFVLFLSVILVAFSACSAVKPLQTEPVRDGLESLASASLRELPPPQEKIVAAVYRFRDQTGQYKPSERVASWSTAVTQGSTSILIKAMEKSGWFIPIERAGLANLLNERKIIHSTRINNNDNTNLHPLLFAGIILEGGIIGYDTNIITSGAGIRYFGAGISGQFRKDRVTIYLRAVSTQTGRILKSVHTTKSIISQQLSGGLFRFIDTNRLLEAEVGFTYNEPTVMAVTEAIDEALKRLIIEGVDEGLWNAMDEKEFHAYTQTLQQNKEDKEEVRRNYFGFLSTKRLRTGFSASVNFTYGSLVGNYATVTQNPGIALQLEQFVKPGISLKLNVVRSQIGATYVFSEPYTSADILLNAYITPSLNLSPYVGFGGGVIAYDQYKRFAGARFFPAATVEAGLDYRLNNWLGLKIGLNYRYLIKDGIDGVTIGTIHDQQWNIFTGITISPAF
ncbi:MAG TPA: CsgG/HfaB family protein [Balneolaceae bacterium]|nr:CsgG/HfaB family protein [Balneolaceae bacterium]